MPAILFRREMKPSVSALPALMIGYAAGTAYFTVGMIAHGGKLSGDYWVVLTWVAIFTCTVGAAIFLPVHFLVERKSGFWKLWICGPFGALAGCAALGLFLGEMALHHLHGGQAAVIGGSTFLVSAILTKVEPE
jgi:drug/metabolite transporter (DMT)-like permease